MDKIVVSFKDPRGITRAWATGSKEKLTEVRKRAETELAEYREDKRKLNPLDPLAGAEYTEYINILEPE